MNRTTAIVLAGFLLLGVFPDTVLAHRFTVMFVAPFAGSEADRGRRVLNGFLFATRERDGHAGEESDGHLGGLDSHVVQVDVSRGLDFVVERLEKIDAEQGPAFVTGLMPDASAASAVWGRALQLAVLVDPRGSPVYERVLRHPERLRTMDGEPFTAAFRIVRGRAPDADAMLGYVAARLIDSTVRAVQGDLTRREVVAAALEDAMGHAW